MVRECVKLGKKAVENALAIRRTEILQGRYKLKKEIKSPLFGKLRVVPKNLQVKEALSKIERTENPYVFFDSRTGKPYNHIKTRFARALEKAGIVGFRFHDLRHTAATYMVLGGTDLATVKEILGHSTIEMTMRTHILPQRVNKRHLVSLVNS